MTRGVSAVNHGPQKGGKKRKPEVSCPTDEGVSAAFTFNFMGEKDTQSCSSGWRQEWHPIPPPLCLAAGPWAAHLGVWNLNFLN